MWHDSYRYGYDNTLNFDKLFDAYTGKNSYSYESREEGDHLFLEIDLPGVKSSDLKIESLLGQVKILGKQKGKDFVQKYSLPKLYDPSTGTAKLEDGVLSLKFNRFETNKPQIHYIQVK